MSRSVDLLDRLAGGDNESIEITRLAFILVGGEGNAGPWGTLHPCRISFYVPPLGGAEFARDWARMLRWPLLAPNAVAAVAVVGSRAAPGAAPRWAPTETDGRTMGLWVRLPLSPAPGTISIRLASRGG